MKNAPNTQGFTLVELLVSISIFTVITTVAVFNHGQFNNSVVLTNLAYEIALSVRQAQFYGITVRQSTAGTFDSGYGIRFDLSTAANQAQYSLYEDRNRNRVYDSGELLETYKIQKGNRISKILLAGGPSNPSIVDVSFVRPNPDTSITAGNMSSPTYATAEVCVASPRGANRIIVIESTGQISVTTDPTNKCAS